MLFFLAVVNVVTLGKIVNWNLLKELTLPHFVLNLDLFKRAWKNSLKVETQMDKADYSIATIDEREKVISILQRNVNLMIELRRTNAPEKLRQLASQFCERVRGGEIFDGMDYKLLLNLFQKKPLNF